MEAPARPWDRSPDESGRAYAAFTAYLHMPPWGRSLAKLGRSLGKSTQLLEGWSSKHAWQARVAEWDRFLEQRAQDAAVDEIQEAAKRHAQVGDLLVAVARQRIVELVNNQDLHQIPVAQLPRWAHVGVVIGRLARGAASEILAGETPAAQAARRPLAEFFEVAEVDGRPVLSELQLARAVAEHIHDAPDDGEDLVEDLDDPEEERPAPGVSGDGVDQPEEPEQPAAAVPHVEPVEELPQAVNGPRPVQPIRWVVEDGGRVKRYREPAPTSSELPRLPPRRRRRRPRP